MDWQWITTNITSNYNLALFIWVFCNPRIGISYLYETVIDKFNNFKNNYLQLVKINNINDISNNNKYFCHVCEYLYLLDYYFCSCVYYFNFDNTSGFMNFFDKPTDYLIECCNEYGRSKALMYNTTFYDINKNKYYASIGKNRRNGLYDDKVVMELIVNCDSELKIENLKEYEFYDIYNDFNNFDYIEENHVMTLRSFLDHHNINYDNKNIYIKYRDCISMEETIIYERIDNYLDKAIDKLL